MKKFRSEVFDLCKSLRSMDQFDGLRQTIASLRLSSNDFVIDPKIDVCTNGIRLRAEFYGILLAYQKKLSSFPSVEEQRIRLTDHELSAIAFGHSFISRFVEMCLADIAEKNSAIGKMLSPYSFFVPINDVPEYSIDTSFFDNAVKSFKDSTVYHSIVDTNVLIAFENIPESAIRDLFGALYKEIIHAPLDTVSSEILSLKVREQNYRPNQKVNPADAIQLISFKLVALREMLSITTSLLYDAILGSDLIVIDENSLINIENTASNAIYSYKTILIQGGLLCPYNDILNTVFLLDIDNDRTKIHDFGRAVSSTFNYEKGNGETTKLTFCLLDEELNPVSNLTSRQ